MNSADQPADQPAWLRLGVAGELARRYGEDARDFLPQLALLLEGALPEAVEVERAGWFGPKKVRAVAVSLGDERFVLRDEGGTMSATVTRVVRGIALKTEDVDIAAWLNRVGDALEARARTNEAAHDALSRMLE